MTNPRDPYAPIALTDRQRQWIENLDKIHIAAQLLDSERECVIVILPKHDSMSLCAKENLDLYGFSLESVIALPKADKAMRDRYQCSRGYHYDELRDAITEEDLTACVALFHKTVDDAIGLPHDENYVPQL